MFLFKYSLRIENIKIIFSKIENNTHIWFILPISYKN